MKRITFTLVVLALVVAACGGDDADQATTTTAPPSSDTTTAAPVPSDGLQLVEGNLDAPFIADADGNALYLFVPDAQGESTCYDDCAAAWPPLVDGVTAGAGLDAALLGSTERTDGTTQVTYAGWPLYYFSGDSAPGDTNGQTLNDVWFVVDAAGNAIGRQ